MQIHVKDQQTSYDLRKYVLRRRFHDFWSDTSDHRQAKAAKQKKPDKVKIEIATKKIPPMPSRRPETLHFRCRFHDDFLSHRNAEMAIRT